MHVSPSARLMPTLAIAYWILGALGLALAISPGYSSPMFPAAGLGLAVALRFRRTGLASVLLGSFLLNLSVSIFKDQPIAGSALLAGLIACGSTFQAFTGSQLVRRLLKPGWEYFDNEKHTLALLMTGGVLACVCSASVGVGSMYGLGIIPADNVFFTWWTWYAGDVLGVFLAAPFFLLLFKEGEKRDWPRLRTILIPLSVALGLSAMVFTVAANYEKEEIRAQVAEEGERIQRQLENRIIAHREMLASMARLIEVNPELSLLQFNYFTHVTLAKQKDVFALSFNPLVRHEDRDAFERRMRDLLGTTEFADFEIREDQANGKLGTAAVRDIYAPVAFISPIIKNKSALGYDIHSNSIRHSAIESSLNSLLGAVTAPVNLIQDAEPDMGVLLLEPILTGNNLAKPGTASDLKISGFAVGVIKVNQMVRIALQDRLNPQLALRLSDTEKIQSDLHFFRSNNWQQDWQNDQKMKEFGWTNTLNVADRSWTIELIPSTAYLQAQRPLFAWVAGVMGIFFAALLQVMLMAISGRTELVRRKVHEQTQFIENQNRQLEIASAQAQAANQAKSRFLATVSHELRTPLNGILGIAKLMQIESNNADQLKQAGIILSSGETLLALLNDVLDLAKVESGKLDLKIQNFKPKALLEDIHRLFEIQAREKNLNLSINWSGLEDAQFSGDEVRIKQILNNLVANAIKFTADGSVTIQAHQLTEDDGSSFLKFNVQDTGIGISAANIPQLFKPFSQLDDAYNRQYEGTGLGLSIVKNLTELMDGEVGVSSQEGVGSNFWFTIKVRTKTIQGVADDEANDLAVDLTNQPYAVKTNRLQQYKGHVLIAEDEKINQTVVVSFLKKMGLSSECVASGEEAVQRIKQGLQPNFILMDLHMPRMDGYEATVQIKAYEQENNRPPIPVVALTASTLTEARQKCMDVGMVGFLSKPISIEVLEQTVKLYCERIEA
ncbi:MAG: CHASE domain-containing protein [Limnobacter sp.]|nr:CHASE domain-containing protein [Limnobacter sp.]